MFLISYKLLTYMGSGKPGQGGQRGQLTP